MKTMRLFPVYLHRFDNPDPQPERVIKLIEEMDPKQKSGNWDEMKVKTTEGLLHLMPEFDFLTNWFRKCLQEYKNHYMLDCEDLDIAVMWGNKSAVGDNAAHHEHTHNLSYISAVYYITEGSPTVFFDPRYAAGGEQVEVCWKRGRDIEQDVRPVPGSLVLFPSWLPHKSRPHTGPDPRYTISFIVLPTGMVNNGMYGFPMAHITLNNYERKAGTG